MLTHDQDQEGEARLRARVKQLEEQVERLERGEIPVSGTARDLLLIQAERTAKVGSWTWDLRTNTVSWSPELFRILGYDPARQAATAEAYFTAIHPDDRESARLASQASVVSGDTPPLESRILWRDGTVREVVTDGVPIYENGKLVRFVGTVVDMTERRAAVRALQRSEILLNEAQRVAHVGSWYQDHVSGVTEWSDELYRIFGVAREDLPRVRTFFELIHEDDRDRCRALAQQAASTGTPVNTEFRIRRKTDGAVRHCLCHAQTLYDDRGRMMAFVGTVFDVTERMELELQLRQAQKMEALGRLAGGVAHEFNNLLTVILGHAQLLDPRSAGEEQRAIVQAAESAAELTRNLLSFSRQAVRDPSILDASELVATAGKLAQRVIGREIRLIVERASESCTVRADANQLQQMLLNLVINARDAMPAGGELRLRTFPVTLDPDRAARIPNASAGQYVVIEVGDTGSGMDEATKARMFEPFFTTKSAGKGTGLGLSIVYGTVRQSGGAIEVDSWPGRGTTFRIYLPAHTGTPVLRAPLPVEAPPGVGTVMVIEDEPEVAGLIARILIGAGYTVRWACDAAEADRLWRAHGPLVDLLITDVVMPERGGPQTARLFRSERPDLRVLFMSGYAPEESGEITPRDWLEKPFSPEALLARVRAALT